MPNNVVSAAEADNSIDLGSPDQQASQPAEFPVGPERFPTGSVGQDLATRASALDPYRATDAEIVEIQQSIAELVSSSQSNVAELQPAIDELAILDAAEQKKRDELQRVADVLSEKLSGLAIQNFRSANRAYSTMSIEVTESDELETQRRTAQSLELVADDSTATYTQVAAELQRVVEIQNQLRKEKADLELEQETRQRLLLAASDLQDAFTVVAQTRAERIQQRSNEAIAGERQDTPLAHVGPFIVNQSIAEPLTALLADAAEDGIVFGGWGQRPVSRQIELRKSHCGSSEWAIFDKRSGTCSPPTARPGRSQHELGLAIDFTENGSILNRSSPGFVWLRANAARYGLKNLPSEPWHWSTTGR